MRNVLNILDKMRDQVLQLEYSVKVDKLSTRDFDKMRDLLNEHRDMLSELGSEIASAEDLWRRNL